MPFPAYVFYNPENVQTINELVDRAIKRPSVFYFCTREYIDVRKQFFICQRLIKYNQHILKNPKRFNEDIKFYLENKDNICDFLYRLKNKSKRIPYYSLKESFVNSINILNGQVDRICMERIESLQLEGVAEMINSKRLMTVDELIKADIITAAGSAILGASIAELKGAIIGGFSGLVLFLIFYFCETNK